MSKMRKSFPGLVLLGLVFAFAAPAAVSAQGDCRQCNSASYCEELCQWEFFGEYYFDICRNWTYPCVEYSAATIDGQPPFFLSKGLAVPEDAPVQAVAADSK